VDSEHGRSKWRGIARGQGVGIDVSKQVDCRRIRFALTIAAVWLDEIHRSVDDDASPIEAALDLVNLECNPP